MRGSLFSGAEDLPVPTVASVLRVRPALARQLVRRAERSVARAQRWRERDLPPLPVAGSELLPEAFTCLGVRHRLVPRQQRLLRAQQRFRARLVLRQWL